MNLPHKATQHNIAVFRQDRQPWHPSSLYQSYRTVAEVGKTCLINRKKQAEYNKKLKNQKRTLSSSLFFSLKEE